MKITDIIAALEATTKRTEKEQILSENQSDLLRKVLLYAYDPFKRFHISKYDELVVAGDASFEDYQHGIFSTLDHLASRELSGNQARKKIGEFLELLNKESGELLLKVIRKDLRCGVSDSTINKVFDGLIPTFDVQLAKSIKDAKIVYPAFVDPKYDGLRCLAVFDGKEVEFLSRGGKPFDTLSFMEEDVKAFLKNQPGVLDCEVMSKSFNDTTSGVKRKKANDKTKEARLKVFDYLSFDDFSAQSNCTPYKRRIEFLKALAVEYSGEYIEVVFPFIAKCEEDAYEFFELFVSQGYEGAMVKNMHTPYEFKRSSNVGKIKPEEPGDFEVIALEEGTGKNKGKLGAVVIDFDGVQTRVGGGFSDKEREQFWNDPNSIIGALIEVEYMEVTKSAAGGGKMRHSRFKRIRSMKGSKV